jgi:flavoprotein
MTSIDYDEEDKKIWVRLQCDLCKWIDECPIEDIVPQIENNWFSVAGCDVCLRCHLQEAGSQQKAS